ncbi:signal peptidase II [Patescibacteria group bacterium]|nr:signal peptidase II [Patescibacteria group bacterium]
MILAVVALLVDQVVKTLYVGGYVVSAELLSWLKFGLVYNTGLAFGLGRGYGLIISVAGFIVFLYFLWIYRDLLKSGNGWLGVGLVTAGALSNIIDRLIYSGAVVDYIDVTFYSVFNLADVYIVVGVIFLMLGVVCRGEKK